jgi:KUP system potassium uptake protein
MTMGKGGVIGGFTKQKINTTSSTEAEIVGVHDGMGSILWVTYFLEAQVYPVKPVTIHQDNMSTMLLANNGRASSSKRTRHINIRYFFITDRIGRREIAVKYCPTDDMIADFYTKPLNGSKFRKFRNLIMNCGNDVDDDTPTPLCVPITEVPKTKLNDPLPNHTYKDALIGSQECVGSNRTNQKYVTNEGRTSLTKAKRTTGSYSTVSHRNRTIRLQACKQQKRAAE